MAPTTPKNISQLLAFLSGKPEIGPTNLNEKERWMSGLGGGALVLAGLRRGGIVGVLAALAGGALVSRGLSGRCAVKARLAKTPHERQVAAERGWHSAAAAAQRVVIQRPIEDVYAFCRDFRNLSQFMQNVRRVDIEDDRHSHWIIEAPLGNTLEWDTIVTEDVPNTRIAWESTTESPVKHTGSLTFSDVVGLGTEVQAVIAYEPPAGEMGRIVAKLWGDSPGAQARDDLLRLKRFLEAGQDHVAASEDGD
ncbi:SRPBCC family protein [Bordetella bronchialis]|uniref:SRPBCC family protein n=1 Tax=Bordetella bronchialis TaxID=463025 RepID=UPI000A95EA7A|nr:SRPBCC family protein [Bordetella bronchialis]